jgi:hypothetical protein
MSDKIVPLAMFQNPVEAQIAKNRLEAEGIRVLLTGDDAGIVFSGLGGVSGTVHLEVSEENYPKAIALLESFDEEDDEKQKEQPPSTAITGEASQSSASRTDIQTTAATRPINPGADTRIAAHTEEPSLKDFDEDDDATRSPLTWQADAYAGRACLAAIISVMLLGVMLFFPGACLAVLCGIAVNLYAMVLFLGGLSFKSNELSLGGKIKLWLALMITIMFWFSLLGIVIR